jgi:hypothetical protein
MMGGRFQYLFIFAFVIQFFIQPLARAGGTFDTLTPDQQRYLLSENTLSLYPVTNSWPRCQIYAWVPHTPEGSAGVFVDYSNQKNYVHRIVKSEILRTFPDQKTVEISYGLGLAPILAAFFPSPEYKVFSHIDKISNGNPGYEVRWNLSKVGFLKELKGAARFEPVENGTLISYWSTLEPSLLPYSFAPGYVIESMKRGCREALESVAAYIKTVHEENPAYVEQRINTLLKTVGPITEAVQISDPLTPEI